MFRHVKKITALALAAVLAFSGLAVNQAPTALAEETVPGETAISPKEQLKYLLGENLIWDLDLDEIKSVDIEWKMKNSAIGDIYNELWHFKAKNSKTKYDFFDNENYSTPLVITSYKSGKYCFWVYDEHTYGIKATKGVKEVSSVKTLYKNEKKSELVVYGKNKKYTTYKFDGDNKIKKGTVYSKSGKTYKKGKKKISKKAYNKYVKSVKKLEKVKLIKITDAIECPAYLTKAKTRAEKTDKGCLYFNEFNMNDEPSYQIKKVFKNVGERYEAFEYAADLLGPDTNPIPEDTGNVSRLVFGAPVKNPATGITYEQTDWVEALKDQFNGFVSPYSMTNQSETDPTQRDLALDLDEEDITVTREEVSEVYNGDEAVPYKGVKFIVSCSDTADELIFFAEGPYTGLIAYYESVSSVNPDAAYDYCTYTYGAPASEEDSLFSQNLSVSATGPLDRLEEAGIPTRSISVNDKNDATKALAYNYIVGNNTEFVLIDTTLCKAASGRFYVLDDTTGEKVYFEDIFEDDHEFYNFKEEYLNPVNETVQTQYPVYKDANFPTGLFWEPLN